MNDERVSIERVSEEELQRGCRLDEILTAAVVDGLRRAADEGLKPFCVAVVIARIAEVDVEGDSVGMSGFVIAKPTAADNPEAWSWLREKVVERVTRDMDAKVQERVPMMDVGN